MEDNSFTLTVLRRKESILQQMAVGFETKAGNVRHKPTAGSRQSSQVKVKTAIGNVQTGGKITVTNKLDATDKYVVEVVTTKPAEVVVP